MKAIDTQKLHLEKAHEINKALNLFVSGMLKATQNKEQQSQNVDSTLILNQGDDTMKNITLRKDGRYVARIYKQGQSISAYAHTLKQAQEKLKQLKKKQITYTTKQKNYTFEEWNNYWLETYKKPFIQYKNYSDLLTIINEINKKLGTYNLKQLTAQIIQEFYNTYTKSRKKEKIILYINASLNKAVQNNIIYSNPCNIIVKDRKIKYNEQPFTIEEQKLILETIKDTDIECYIYLYLLTGIRLNEINNNIEENIIGNKFRAKNEKQHSDNIKYKYIDISTTFKQYLLNNKNKFTLKPSTIYHKFKKVLQKLNIDGHIHKLRHTFATNYYYLGIPLKLIKEWCGHSTPNITEDIYIGVNRESIKNELIKLYNNLLFEF